MDAIYEAQELKHKRVGRRASTIFGILVLILMIIPLFKYPTPPPGQEGILVNLGLPDQGQGEENAPPAETAEPEPQPPQPEETTPPPPAEPEVTQPEPEPQKEVVTTEDPDAIRLKQEQEKKRQQEADRIQKEREAEAERQRQAEEDRQRKEAEAEAQRQKEEAAQKTKDQIGGLFGTGKGKGETGKPGNQGDPEGDPNSDRLSGVSDGVGGNIGGNLRGRGIVASPKISKATERGTVVIYLCVSTTGAVSEARVQQRGTTGGASAQQQALANARKWKFSKGELDKQCGTITYNFSFQ